MLRVRDLLRTRDHAHAGGSAKVVYWLIALVLLAVPTARIGSLAAPDHVEASDRLNGTWQNLASDAGRADIERGVEQGIEGMFALGKPTARSRLRKANPAISTLEIAIASGTIRVNLGHGRNTSAPPGAWQKARSAAGDAIRVRYAVMPDGVLKMESVSDGGAGRHTFRVSNDGSALRHDVRVESSRLPHAVRYTLNFRRTP